MRIKRYIFFSIILMLIVAGIVYSQVDKVYTFDVFGVPVTLPVAVWIIVPMFILFLASFFHMSYYSFINFMVLKRYRKDYDTLIDSFADAIMQEPKSHQYKTTEAKNLGNVTDKSHILPVDFKIDTKDERLKKPLDYVKDITNGIYVDIEGFKLSPKNALLVKNYENRLKSEPIFSGVILKNCSEYPQELCQKALQAYITFNDISKIKDYAKLFTFETLMELIEQYATKEKEMLHEQDIEYILQESQMQLNEEEYMQLAKKIKDVLSPDERLKFFGKLKEKDEKSEAAYLYTLLDLEMIEKAKKFLETTAENELLNFKAYLELKECGKNYPLEMFA
ncbi:hypothetical protein NitYY0826_C0783 [Nitratiruptor sp. YY08-26]|uniref:hypothetical protein n=1 Tax=Nitratiruptor sp. YY08-26 TaxID=2724900 RepID=UPI0019152821|nr:hypothetical protein [Nitratiruptor sp. YY08-26]BCD65851.1 hypothetical protein NitYY0826_C0783 [Nitratiruptor sp. YY08-26]